MTALDASTRKTLAATIAAAADPQLLELHAHNTAAFDTATGDGRAAHARVGDLLEAELTRRGHTVCGDCGALNGTHRADWHFDDEHAAAANRSGSTG